MRRTLHHLALVGLITTVVATPSLAGASRVPHVQSPYECSKPLSFYNDGKKLYMRDDAGSGKWKAQALPLGGKGLTGLAVNTAGFIYALRQFKAGGPWFLHRIGKNGDSLNITEMPDLAGKKITGGAVDPQTGRYYVSTRTQLFSLDISNLYPVPVSSVTVPTGVRFGGDIVINGGKIYTAAPERGLMLSWNLSDPPSVPAVSGTYSPELKGGMGALWLGPAGIKGVTTKTRAVYDLIDLGGGTSFQPVKSDKVPGTPGSPTGGLTDGTACFAF